MASMYSRWKHLTFPLIFLSIAFLFVLTNYLFFTINYSRHLQDEFKERTTYVKSLRNPDWFEVVSRDIIDERIRIGVVNVDRVKNEVPTHTKRNTTSFLKRVRNPMWFEVVKREFKDERINIGLVNMDGRMDEVQTEAKMVKVHFDLVRKDVRWSDLSPERVNENTTCPDIPMPRFEDYQELDVVVARLSPPRDYRDGELKNVFRLQMHLLVANLLVRSGRKGNGPVLAVLVESFNPMMEIFGCDDLLWNEDGSWVFKPDLTKLKKMVLMPVGPCQFVPPISDFGDPETWRRQTDHHLPQPREAYVTVLHTSEDYVCGAIVLAQSLIQSNTTKDLILLVDDNISAESIKGLRAAGWITKRINRIRSPYSRKDTYNEWNYSKLRIWQLTQYHKVMFIDADLVVYQNLDDFFVYPQLSATGNYQKHFFNSGVMLVEPSECTFNTLMQKMVVVESYNGGDQGFLNQMFMWWHRLPHELNFCKVFVNESEPEHLIDEGVYAVHYTGLKPWKCSEERDCNWDLPEFNRYASDTAHEMWWQVYRAMPEKIKPYCSQNRNRDNDATSTKGHQ